MVIQILINKKLKIFEKRYFDKIAKNVLQMLLKILLF